MNRRAVLIGLGAAGLGVASAGGWRLYDNHVFSTAEGPAYLPWVDWQQDGPSPWERLVRAAVLAANPHNSQPWKFHLLDAGVDVYADTSRRIGQSIRFFAKCTWGLAVRSKISCWPPKRAVIAGPSIQPDHAAIPNCNLSCAYFSKRAQGALPIYTRQFPGAIPIVAHTPRIWR